MKLLFIATQDRHVIVNATAENRRAAAKLKDAAEKLGLPSLVLESAAPCAEPSVSQNVPAEAKSSTEAVTKSDE